MRHSLLVAVSLAVVVGAACGRANDSGRTTPAASSQQARAAQAAPAPSAASGKAAPGPAPASPAPAAAPGSAAPGSTAPVPPAATAAAASTAAGAQQVTAPSAQPRGGASIAAEAARLSGGIDALLTRASNGVAYEVYAGAFRGPDATLADNAGNDVDKALLLRGLVRAANPAAITRFASCMLKEPEIDRLIAAARSAYRAPVVLPAVAGRLAGQATNAKARDLLRQTATLWAGIGAENRDESARLLSMLQTANAPLAAPASEDLRAIVSRHTWLQLQTGNGWQDLDPALPNAKPGTALCAAQSTSAELPDNLYDTVTARVRVERLQHGSIDTQTSVEGTWRTMDVARSSLTFAFAESSGLKPSTRHAAAPAGMIGYTPVMRVGDRILAGAPVYVPRLTKTASTAMGGALGGALSAFGNQPAAQPATAPPEVPEPVGMWLQVTVNAPGTRPETIESAIFDRVGYADRAVKRAALTPLPKIDDGSGKYLPFGAVWNVAVSAGTATAGAGDGKSIDPKSTDAASILRGIGGMQRAYYTLRRAIFAETSGAQAPPIFNVRPGVSLFGLTWRTTGAPASRSASLLLDIASDHALPEGGDAAAAARWATSSLVAERLTANARSMLTLAANGGDLSRASTSDVFAVFGAARQANIPLVLVRGAGDIGASVPTDAKPRLAQALSEGSIAALAPAGPVTLAGTSQFGWWLVNRDGTIRDQMESGRHQEFEEEAVAEEEEAAEEAPQVRKIGCGVRLTVFFIALLGFQVEPNFETGEQLAETSHAVYEWQEAEDKIREATETGECEGTTVGSPKMPFPWIAASFTGGPGRSESNEHNRPVSDDTTEQHDKALLWAPSVASVLWSNSRTLFA